MKIPFRGTADNPPNRFERLVVELEEPAERNPRTQFLRESARSIISRNDSPDISFSASLNPYRGCEHGCPYCYARPFHEYLGFSSGLDFETRIVVKENAAELLREAPGQPGLARSAAANNGNKLCVHINYAQSGVPGSPG